MNPRYSNLLFIITEKFIRNRRRGWGITYYCITERYHRYRMALFDPAGNNYFRKCIICSRRKSCLNPPRMSCSMRRMSVRGTAALRRNSMRTVSRKPVLGVATRRHCLYRARTCSQRCGTVTIFYGSGFDF